MQKLANKSKLGISLPLFAYR